MKRRRLTDLEIREARALDWYGKKLRGVRSEDIARIAGVSKRHVDREIACIPEAIRLKARRDRSRDTA